MALSQNSIRIDNIITFLFSSLPMQYATTNFDFLKIFQNQQAVMLSERSPWANQEYLALLVTNYKVLEYP
jgi:hypothetical protein